MIATWTDFTLDQNKIIESLTELNVKLLPNAKLSRDLRLTRTLSGEILKLNADHIVLVGARTSNNELLALLETKLSDTAIYQTGDCLAPSIIQAAVLSGHTVARKILDPSSSAVDVKREQIFQ